VLTQAHSLDTVGVMGRSVEDLALLADALQAHDEGDPASLVSSRPRLLATATETGRSHRSLPSSRRTPGGIATRARTRPSASSREPGRAVTEVSLDHTTERGIGAAMTVQRVELAFHFGPCSTGRRT